jgi:hypothetical protein
MLVTAFLAAQYAGTLELFDTSRIDARSNQPFTIAPTPPPREVAIAADASMTPTARLRLSDRRWDYLFTYSPTFTVTDIELSPNAQPVVVNSGTASVGWHDRTVRIFVTEAASYGWENLAYLYGTPVAGQTVSSGQAQGQTGQMMGQTSTQPLGQTSVAPTVPLQLFPFGSSSTTAGGQVRATRSLTLSMSGGYLLSGNLTNSPQAATAYPEQFGPSATGSVAYSVSPIDSLVTIAKAQQITTPAGVCASGAVGQLCREVTPTVSLSETFRHRFSATASMSGSLGVAASVYQLPTGNAWGILPVGGVSFADRFSAPPKDPLAQLEPSGILLSADLAPTVNLFTGAPSTRIQLSASVTDHVAPDIVVAFVAGALETVPLPRPDPSPLTVFSGGVDVRVRVTHLISMSLGVQAFWQSQENVGVLPAATTTEATGRSTSASEVGYVALTVRLPKLRF